jgi:V/A-type H+-transporting ATPase subunit D
VIGPARTRADRLRLLRRIAVAEHAAELLQSKEEALERERDRLEGYARRADEEWRDAASAAARALVRARLMGAADELGAHVPASVPAVVRPDWQVSMGVTYPGSVGVEPGASVPLVSTAALGPAVDRYRDALSAAARRLDAELVATRRRRRALEDRLVPSLRHASHELDLHLDELDRDEATRVRIAGGGQAW